MHRRALLLTLPLVLALPACSLAGAETNEDVVTIGYQSKTINTVTAGTLLRERGYFEKALEEVDPDLSVEWQDYDTGAPITAQMLAGKIDIGSMGDYPLLINGSRAGTGDDGDSMVAVTGWNERGALNGVVADRSSDVRDLTDLAAAPSRPVSGARGTGPWSRRWRPVASTPTTTSRWRTRTRRWARPRCRAARSTPSASSWPGRPCWPSATTRG